MLTNLNEILYMAYDNKYAVGSLMHIILKPLKGSLMLVWKPRHRLS